MQFSQWNAVKGGGDTITGMLDSIQEQVGLRTETIAASARGLQYHSVATHRVKQWLTAKEDLDFYPSLFHARRANNTCASVDDSLDYMICKFLMWAVRSRYTGVGLDSIEGATLTNDDLDEVNRFFPIEISDGSSSSAGEGRSRSTRTNNTPNPVVMPFATCKTNNTPKHQGKANTQAHQLRCDLCVGFPYGQLVEFREEKKTARSNASATPRVKEIKRKCAYCGRGTDYFCHGCSRYLCFSAPKPKTDKGSTKYPKYFSTKIPVMDSNGNLLMNGDGTFQYVERLTKWTCYNAAHKNGQTTMLGKRRSELINIARGIAPGAGREEDMEADEGGIAIQSAAASATGIAAAPGAAPRPAAVPVTVRKRPKRTGNGT